MKKPKRILSLALSIVLILGLLPVSAMAKEVNTLVLNAVCLFSSTKGEATEFTFTTEKAGVYRFDLKDTNPKTHGGHLKLSTGSDELDPYSADYIYYGDMQPHISQSWNLNANTTYRLTHTPDEDVDPNTTHHYSLKPTYAGVPVNPVLSAGQSAQIKFLNVGGGCEDYYVAHFNVRVATSGFYRIDSTNRSYISIWGQLPQTVYFKNGKDYSFSANPASQSSAPANDTITLTAVQADCKALTETSPVSLTEDGWISFTAPSAGTYCFKAQDSEGYLEFITAVNDETFLAEYQQEELIQELEHFSMQSGETVYFYVQHVTPGTGQMTVTKTGGSTEPDPTPETLTLVSSSPANGATNVQKTDNLILTFSQNLSQSPNWEKGNIYVKSYYTDTLVKTIDEQTFNNLGGSISGSQITIPGALDFSVEKYYVLIDPDVITAANPEIEAFTGISDKDELSFAPKLYGADFKTGRDSLKFNNYSVKYSDDIMEWQWTELLSKAGHDAVSIYRLLSSRLRENAVCFGMAAFMQQLNRDVLSAPQFGAHTSSEITKTAQVKSTIAYYHLAQYLPQFRKADYVDRIKSQADLAEEIVTALVTEATPVIVNLKESESASTPAWIGAGHTVLAYAVDAFSDESNYIVYIADSNSMVSVFRSVNVGTSSYFNYPSIMLVNKKTYSIVDYTMYPATKDTAPAPYSIDIWLTSVYSGDDAALLDSLTPYGDSQYTTQSLPFGVLETSATDFTVAANGRKAVVSDGVITGDLELYAGSNTAGSTVNNTYYVEKAESYIITFSDAAEERTTTLYCNDSDISFLGEVTSNAASLQFLSNGEVYIAEANGSSTVSALFNTDVNSLLGIKVTAQNNDLCLHPENNECKISSTSNLGAISVQGIGINAIVNVKAQIDGTEAYTFERKNVDSANELVIAQHGNIIASSPVPGTEPSHSNSGGNSSDNSSYSVTVKDSTHGAVTADRKTASSGTTVTLTISPEQGWTLETLTVTNASGKEIDLNIVKVGEKYTFKMPSRNVTVAATFMEDNSILNNFVDVPSDSYYYDAVLWAVENSITTGTDAIHFSPDGICTRAQAVTFLWRAAGSPAPKSSAMPFIDVPAGSYYYNAVLWAVENGITKGTSDTAFSPDKTCTRAQTVTFLWRSQNAPAAGSSNPFTDVAAGDYYADAVLWAVKNDITKGTGAATFSPDADCTRAQIVTLLWRTLA